MSAVVIDASVAVKWFLPEAHAAAARRMLRGRRELLAPDLIWAEVGNALWKRVQRAEVPLEVARGILRDFRRFPLSTYTAQSLLEPAWDLAERLKISVYDGLYVALAVGRSCAFVTADRQLYRTLRGTHVSSVTTWIEHSR